jgi:hypothetical protein
LSSSTLVRTTAAGCRSGGRFVSCRDRFVARVIVLGIDRTVVVRPADEAVVVDYLVAELEAEGGEPI